MQASIYALHLRDYEITQCESLAMLHDVGVLYLEYNAHV